MGGRPSYWIAEPTDQGALLVKADLLALAIAQAFNPRMWEYVRVVHDPITQHWLNQVN